MKSVLTTSNPIHFNSELNTLLGFTNKNYRAGKHSSEKPVMISSTDKVHLKCDCVDGSIVNGIREQNCFHLISFDFINYSPSSLATVNNTNSNISISLLREDAYLCLQNSYISVGFEVLENDNTRYANGDEISLVNFGPVPLFSEADNQFGETPGKN